MRIFAFYLAKMKYAPALGRISAYICVIKLVYHTLTQIAMAASPFAMTATVLFTTVATDKDADEFSAMELQRLRYLQRLQLRFPFKLRTNLRRILFALRIWRQPLTIGRRVDIIVWLCGSVSKWS